jgi:hypothetical protein
MKFGFTVKGYRAEVELTILQHRALLNFQVQAVDPPAVAKITATVATISLNVGIARVAKSTVNAVPAATSA